MTSDEVERYNPTPLELTRTQTDDWYSVFPSIIKLAEFVADTEFVPDAMRRRPAAVAAAVLTGRELGLPPMLALRHLFIVKGKVGQSAELMRALVLRAGHEIRYIEATDNRCVVEGRRKDEKDWLRVQFTAQDAKAAGIDLRGYGADKLVARATSRLARRKFADVIMGLPTVDELEDYSDTASVVELAPAAEGPAVQRKRPSRKPKAAATQPKPAPPPVAAAPDDDDDLLDDDTTPDVGAGTTIIDKRRNAGRSSEPPPAPTQEPARTVIEPRDILNPAALTELEQGRGDLAAAQANLQAAELLAEEISTEDNDVANLFTPPQPEEPATRPQHAKLQVLFSQLGVTERDDQLTIISHILGYNFSQSRSKLTRPEAIRIIDTLETWQINNTADDTTRDILNQAALDEAETEDQS